MTSHRVKNKLAEGHLTNTELSDMMYKILRSSPTPLLAKEIVNILGEWGYYTTSGMVGAHITNRMPTVLIRDIPVHGKYKVREYYLKEKI